MARLHGRAEIVVSLKPAYLHCSHVCACCNATARPFVFVLIGLPQEHVLNSGSDRSHDLLVIASWQQGARASQRPWRTCYAQKLRTGTEQLHYFSD